MRSSADYITIPSEYRFSVHTRGLVMAGRVAETVRSTSHFGG